MGEFSGPPISQPLWCTAQGLPAGVEGPPPRGSTEWRKGTSTAYGAGGDRSNGAQGAMRAGRGPPGHAPEISGQSHAPSPPLVGRASVRQSPVVYMGDVRPASRSSRRVIGWQSAPRRSFGGVSTPRSAAVSSSALHATSRDTQAGRREVGRRSAPSEGERPTGVYVGHLDARGVLWRGGRL